MTDWINKTHLGDCRELLPAMAADGVKVQTCVTSPPYFGLRDYGCAGQMGLEATPGDFVLELVKVFRAVREVLADDGTLWLNLGDSYASGGRRGGGSYMEARGDSSWHMQGRLNGWRTAPAGYKDKDMLGIPWRVAFALQEDGWYLRSDIIWHKPNPMPESVTDRPAKAHEYLFLLAKSKRYYFDHEAIKEPAVQDERRETFRGGAYVKGSTFDNSQGGRANVVGNVRLQPTTRNKRTVWTVASEPFHGAHFATFPRSLVEPCVLAGAGPGGIVLDPFMGSGTVAQVATDLGRQFIGCELSADYLKLHELRRTTTGMAL